MTVKPQYRMQQEHPTFWPAPSGVISMRSVVALVELAQPLEDAPRARRFRVSVGDWAAPMSGSRGDAAGLGREVTGAHDDMHTCDVAAAYTCTSCCADRTCASARLCVCASAPFCRPPLTLARQPVSRDSAGAHAARPTVNHGTTAPRRKDVFAALHSSPTVPRGLFEQNAAKILSHPQFTGKESFGRERGGQKKRGPYDPTRPRESKLGPHERFVRNFGPSV